MKRSESPTPELVESPPNFEIRDPINRKFIRYDFDQAIRWISSHKSLQLKFAEIGYRRIDFLESSLWLDHSLSATAKNQLQLQLELTQLENETCPMWENAIRSARGPVARLISYTIRDWLNAITLDNFEKTTPNPLQFKPKAKPKVNSL
jgi:hypothetical protein